MKAILKGVSKNSWVRKQDVLLLLESLSRADITFVAAVEKVKSGMWTANIQASKYIEVKKEG